MYKSPIEIFQKEIEMQMEGEILKAVQRVGVNVDKEELLKALKYDRAQYSKGYEDAKRESRWIPVEDTERRPEHESLVLVSFANVLIPDIARYKEDEEGGAFYPRGNVFPYKKYGLIVNAWQTLPKQYEGE